MGDADNLDALSNAELRAKMISLGLPNVPITDSSRKVLVKRVRASLGGNSSVAPPAPSPRKTATNRRETLQPTVATAAPVDSAAKTRRSIAFQNEPERRRKPETAPTAAPIAAPVVAPPANAPAAPKATRRSSQADRREVQPERILRQPETIAEEATTTKPATVRPATAKPATAIPATAKPAPQVENTLEINSLIILESDDEEDEQLAQAAQHAEDQYKHKLKTAKPKLSTTTTTTHAYVGQSLYPTLEPVQPVVPPVLQQRHQAPSYSQASRTNLASAYATTGRYTSYLSSATQSYASPAVASTSAAAALSYRRSPPRTYSDEFSDEPAEEEDATVGVKFESDFARNLARLRNERIGDRSSSYTRHTTGTGSMTGPRRSLRPEQESSAVTLARWWHILDSKYNLKSKLFILIVMVLLYIAYRIFY